MPTVFVQRPTANALQHLGAVRRFLMVWAPAVIGMVVISIESTPTFSGAHTGVWLGALVERFHGHLSMGALEELNHILRKTGHFSFYGLLCVLFVRGWLLTLARDASLPTPAWRWRSWALGLASQFLVASADELHQSFLPSRTGLFSDVVLDTCGGLFVSAVVMAVSWWIRRVRGRSMQASAYLQA